MFEVIERDVAAVEFSFCFYERCKSAFNFRGLVLVIVWLEIWDIGCVWCG